MLRYTYYYTMHTPILTKRTPLRPFSLAVLCFVVFQVLGSNLWSVQRYQSAASQLIEHQNDILTTAATAREKAIAHCNIGLIHFQQGDYGQAQLNFQQSLDFDPASTCTSHGVLAKVHLGYLDAMKSNANTGSKSIREAILCARELKDTELEARLHLLDAQWRLHFGNYGDAFKELYAAQAIYSSEQNVSGRVEVDVILAEALIDLEEYSEAKRLLEQALKHNKTNEVVALTLSIYRNLGQLYFIQDKWNYATTYAQKSLAIAHAIESHAGIQRAQLLLYYIKQAQHNSHDAGTQLQAVIDHSQQSGVQGSLRNDLSLALIHWDLSNGRSESVIGRAKEVLDGNRPYWSLHQIMKLYAHQINAHYKLNQFKEAFDLREQLAELESNSEVTSAVEQYQLAKSRAEKEQRQEAMLKNEVESKLNYQEQKISDLIKYSVLSALILLTVLLVLLFRQVRIKQLSNKELENRNKLINRQNHELRQMNAVLDEARKEAEEGSIAKSNFLAVTSHEIRTPMNGIMGMASLLLESNLNEEQRKYVETIETSSENLLTILNDILDFSKIEAGKMNIETSLIDLEKLLDEVMIIFSKQAKDKKIELSKFIGNAMITQFRGDLLRIRQVLINLISNAVKFTENGYVKIVVELDELLRAQTEDARIAKLRFSVKDNGIGISEEKQKKIFESFEQEDTSTSRKYGGIGLGLSISKKLVELMGGEIGLSSEKNVGTTFYFTLNVEIPKGLVRKVPVHLQDDKRAKLPHGKFSEMYPLKIMVAEDNPFNKLFIDKLFEKFGYSNYVHAENGTEVLSKLKEHPVDIILMDIQMPEMDGIQATKRIIDLYGEDRPYIIALTADANEGNKQEYLSYGMDGFLSKPFKAEALQDILKEYSKKLKDTTSVVE